MPLPCASLMPNRIDRKADARKVVYMASATSADTTLWSASSRSAQSPEMSAFASSIALKVSFSASRTARPLAFTCCGPRPCISSCIRMCVKNASKRTARRSRAPSATWAIGMRTLSNLACWTFFSITRFELFSRITRSSFGRLKAAVWTPTLPSPAANTRFTTRIGASAPMRGLRNAGSMGSESSSAWSRDPNTSSFRVSASSRRAMKASNAALYPNHSSS